jgi:flagellar basal body-associated protein FliL
MHLFYFLVCYMIWSSENICRRGKIIIIFIIIIIIVVVVVVVVIHSVLTYYRLPAVGKHSKKEVN